MACVNTDDMVGTREGADLLHVNRTTYSNWHGRGDKNLFPNRIQTISDMPIWDALHVAYWWTYYKGQRKIPKQGHLTEEWEAIVASYPEFTENGRLTADWQQKLEEQRKNGQHD
jgi:hypothetical protein